MHAALNISYDQDADVLYVAFGEPQVGVDEEIGEGVYVRTSEDGSGVVGLTVIDFVRRFSRQPALQLPLQITARAA